MFTLSKFKTGYSHNVEQVFDTVLLYAVNNNYLSANITAWNVFSTHTTTQVLKLKGNSTIVNVKTSPIFTRLVFDLFYCKNRYYSEVFNECRGPSPWLSARVSQLRRNVAYGETLTTLSDLNGPGIDPYILCDMNDIFNHY